MKRFNQAWLLDNKNENAYWGFASVYFMFGDYTKALKQLDKGLFLNPKSSNILTDKATIYTAYYAQDRKAENLDTALRLFNESYEIDPRNGNTLFKLSLAYFYKGDCQNAKRFLKEHNDVGGKAATKDYVEALAQQCK
jgi:tetratricopeptide (TPR) repeat protein